MQRVIVAMSGGVDSSVVAALFKNGLSTLGERCDVVGVFMLMHKNSNPQDAKIVAKKLGIKFKVLDARKEFKKWVIDYALKEYKLGNTPNPCVECNKYIKFRFLFEQLKKLKADFVATGHYARIQREIRNSKLKTRNLLVARDRFKDQSYFLWQLNQKQLSKILFPLGDYTKEQVRGLAKKYGLPVFNKKESQDICFTLPRQTTQLRGKAGDIIAINGKIIGKHKGLSFYTIGQRKGIEISSTKPYYVVRKDYKRNALIVSQSEGDLLRKKMIVKNVNWLSGKPYFRKCKIKIRSTSPMVSCRVFKIQNSKLKIIFNVSQRAVTSGQSAVFYIKNQLIGGGVIE